MFGLGSLNNAVSTFINIVLGFEFESKIVPFGAKSFIENITVFTVVGLISIFDLKSKEDFRVIFVLYLIIGILSTLLLF